MTCEQCKDNLTAFIEGDLAPPDEQALREHLGTCPGCARALSEMRALVATLRRLPEVEPPAGLRESLRDIPRRGEAASPAWWQRSRTVFTAVAGAAAAALIIGAGLHFYQGESGPMAPPMVAEHSAPRQDEMSAGEPAPGGGADEFAEPVDAVDGAEAEMPAGEGAEIEADAPTRSGRDTPRAATGPSAAEGGVEPSRSRGTVRVPREEPATQPRIEPEPSPGVPDADSAPSPAPPAPAPEAAVTEREGEASSRAPRMSSPRPDRAPEGGAAGPRGPAGPAGPAMRSRMAEVEERAFSEDTLTLPAPKYLDAAEGTASTQVGEGTAFTVGVTPPHERITGTIVPATVRLEAEADVARARVTVAGSDDLDLVGPGDDGVLFEGPLKAGQQTVLSVRMLARRAGTQSMTLRVRSTDPVVDTQLDVGMGEFSEPIPPAERLVQFNFVGTPIREAVSEVTRQSGMSVVVDPGVGDATVTARADDAIPAAGALRAIAEAAGLQITERDGATVVESAGEDQ